MEGIEITVPKVFWDDHVDRDLDDDTVIIKHMAKHYTLSMSVEGWSELWSDADFYIYMGIGSLGFEYGGLVSSARATLKRMKATGRNQAGALMTAEQTTV